MVNEDNLYNGSVVTITIHEKEDLIYHINIIKDEKDYSLICYIVFGIGVVSLLSSIIYVIKKKK